MVKKLLVVDDSKVVTNLVKKYLADQTYEITISHSGEDALEILSDYHPDLILLDVVMEGLSGFDVLEQIKANSSLKKIPVIFITSLDKGDDITKGFELGAEDYIIKPFTPNELQEKIETTLEQVKSPL